jgi:hypothetical protein
VFSTKPTLNHRIVAGVVTCLNHSDFRLLKAAISANPYISLGRSTSAATEFIVYWQFSEIQALSTVLVTVMVSSSIFVA